MFGRAEALYYNDAGDEPRVPSGADAGALSSNSTAQAQALLVQCVEYGDYWPAKLYLALFQEEGWHQEMGRFDTRGFVVECAALGDPCALFLCYQRALHPYPQDPSRAFQVLMDAMQQVNGEGDGGGDSRAVQPQYRQRPMLACLLGWCCANGEGTPLDRDRAYYWYSVAARDGHPAALYYLGRLCVQRSDEAATDDERALHNARAAALLEQAAARGCCPGLFALGECYELGRGVPQDTRRALDLYSCAAAQGDLRAKMGVTRMRRKLGLSASGF